ATDGKARRVGKIVIVTRDRVHWKEFPSTRHRREHELDARARKPVHLFSISPFRGKRRGFMVFFCVLLFFILFPSFSQGADPAPEQSLPPVVVTATRTEVPLNQLTTSLTVITSEEIRERQAETVSEV